MRCSARLNLFHEGESRYQPDGTVPAHTEIADVIKEDDAGGACGIDGLAQQGPHHHIGAPRFVYYCRPKFVVLGAKALKSRGQRPIAEVGAATNHHPRRLSAGVGVNHSNSTGIVLVHSDRVLLRKKEVTNLLMDIQVEVVTEALE